jgi:hypothetical protein
MYTLKVFPITGGSTAETTLTDAVIRSWSNRINGAGRMAFFLPTGTLNATASKIQKYKQVVLYRRKQDGSGEDEAVWRGFLQSHKRTEEGYGVGCAGMLDLFRKRFAAEDETFNGEGSAEAFGLLSDTNSNDGATGVSAGTGGVTTTRDIDMQGRKDILGAWEDIARAHDAEFEINMSNAFNFVPSLGSDKSGTVTLRIRRDGEPGTNLREVEEGEDGEPMVNKLIGTTTAGGGLTSTQQDLTSQGTYGMLTDYRAFNEAQDQTTLDAMTLSLVTQLSNPIQDFQCVPELAEKKMSTLTGQLVTVGLQYGDVVPGDIVTVDIVTESTTVQTTKRVAEIIVDVDSEGNERVRYTLTKAGVFVTDAYLNRDRVGEITRRIAQLERLL